MSYEQPITVDQDDNVGVVALQHSLNVSVIGPCWGRGRGRGETWPNLQLLVAR